MSDDVRKWLKFLISFLGLLGFLYLYRVLFTGEWSETNQPTANFLQATSVLTGLVSGVVATLLGVKASGDGGGGNGSGSRLTAMGSFISPVDHAKAKQILAVFYVLGYAAMAVWAFTIWIGPPDEHRPQIIDGLAAVGIGIAAAVGTSHLGGSTK